MNINEIINWLTLVALVAPLVLALFTYIAQKTHNQKLSNLTARAQIIVQSLEQTSLASSDKKTAALAKLSSYAAEVGIKVTPDQAVDYIESAVNVLKQVAP